MKQLLWGVALAVGLSGCSLFSSKKTVEPTPLQTLKPSVEVKQLWRGSVGETADAALRPALVGDALYAAGAEGTLARTEFGRETWRIRAAKRVTAGVAADDERVVIGSGDGEVLAFDAKTGKPLWKAPVTGEPIGAPLIADGMVITRVGDNQLIAHALADGKRRWIYQRSQAALSLRGQIGMTRVGDLLIAGFSGGKLVAVTLAAGMPRWEASVAIPRGSNEIERLADLVADPVVRGESVCVAAYQGRVACVETQRGVVQWTRDIGSSAGLDLDDRQVYVTEDLGAVTALDVRTGATNWRQDKLLNRGSGRPLVMGDHVAVADSLGWLHVMNRSDGQFVGRLELDSSGVSAPLLAYDGRIVAQSRRGYVYVINLKNL